MSTFDSDFSGNESDPEISATEDDVELETSEDDYDFSQHNDRSSRYNSDSLSEDSSNEDELNIGSHEDEEISSVPRSSQTLVSKTPPPRFIRKASGSTSSSSRSFNRNQRNIKRQVFLAAEETRRFKEMDAKINRIMRMVDALREEVDALKSAGLEGASSSNGIHHASASLPPEEHEVIEESMEESTHGNDGVHSAEEVTTDYMADEFCWSEAVVEESQDTFGIDDFRSCQLGVINAVMDDRDVVCVMPTGGGKSLTYQLPSMLFNGVTLVVSPHISLICDQVMQLNKLGVNAVKLTSTTSHGEAHEIFKKLRTIAQRAPHTFSKAEEIKLVYVTPERITQSSGLRSLLKDLYQKEHFRRIVIDEAHCVSQMAGYRPNYAGLGILRQTFPEVPIIALSATLSPTVCSDVLEVLKMDPITDGRRARQNGTVFFSTSCYRKNLNYTVLRKTRKITSSMGAVASYILGNHSKESGIIYCSTTKLAESLVTGLSRKGINADFYHAKRTPGDKERVHERWLEGKTKVICATTAFGLGIDKPDARFVIHYDMPHSMDYYSQETGRAGRDGKGADCILYFRLQDTLAQISLMQRDIPVPDSAGLALDTLKRGLEMLAFSHDLVTCRKLHFKKHFADLHSSDDPCGHCDNCRRSPDSFFEREITEHAWHVLDIVKAAGSGGSTSRGISLTAMVTSTRQRFRDVKQEKWSAYDVERLIAQLLLSQHLVIITRGTRHRDHQPYLIPGPTAVTLTSVYVVQRLKEAGVRPIYCHFLLSKHPERRRKRSNDKHSPPVPSSKSQHRDTPANSKRLTIDTINHKRKFVNSESEGEDDNIEVPAQLGPRAARGHKLKRARLSRVESELESSDDEMLIQRYQPEKQRKTRYIGKNPRTLKTKRIEQQETISISSEDKDEMDQDQPMKGTGSLLRRGTRYYIGKVPAQSQYYNIVRC